MSGIRAGWEGADGPLELQICVPRGELVGVSRALDAAAKAMSADEVVVMSLQDDPARR